MEPFYPDCLPILIGSLPVSDHHEAVDMVFEATPRIPVWPQLPVHREEDMVPQFAPGMPGLRQDDDRMVVDLGGDDFETELASFYEDYLAVTDNTAPLETSRFALSEKAANGFHVLRARIGKMTPAPVAVKGQVTGPITFGTGLKDHRGRAVYYDPNARDAAVKLLALKAAYQVRALRETGCPVIVFLDEPALAGYGSSEMISISADEITASLEEINDVIHAEGGLAGIHVCANTDWGMILGTSVDIVNFDTYSYFDRFLLYGEQVRQYIGRGGIIAWGLVPTGSPEDLEAATVDSLVQRWEGQCNDLVAIGVDREQLLRQSLISPSCGVGSLSLEQARKVLTLTREVAAHIDKRR
jgi:methionine synthase II (cobalamin-independent)